MLNKIIKAFLFLFVFICLQAVDASGITVKHICGRVFQKNESKDPFSISEGKYQLSSETSILTFLDGQFFAETEEKIEIRMKEESIISLPNNYEFEVRKGVVGFKSLSSPFIIKTPHADARISQGIVVVKSNSIMTRICLIKGDCKINGAGGFHSELHEGQEIAVANGKFSKPYYRSDELRFTWYWVNPLEEPSIKN